MVGLVVAQLVIYKKNTKAAPKGTAFDIENLIQ